MSFDIYEFIKKDLNDISIDDFYSKYDVPKEFDHEFYNDNYEGLQNLFLTLR